MRTTAGALAGRWSAARLPRAWAAGHWVTDLRAPNLWIVLDEIVLYRLIGTPKTMYDQLLQVADTSMRSYTRVQVVPASSGAHAGLAGSFYIASVRGKPDLLYMDAVEGVTIERSALVCKATIEFDLVRSDALARNASRDLILKVAEERWNT